MALSELGAANAHYHRDRACAERIAAKCARDERAQHAHLVLAMQHEIAMFHSGTGRRERDDDAWSLMLGAQLRAVIALPDGGLRLGE